MTEKIHEYICEYRFEGQWWAVTLAATSQAEANARLLAMPYGRVLGQQVVRVRLDAQFFIALLVGLLIGAAIARWLS